MAKDEARTWKRWSNLPADKSTLSNRFTFGRVIFLRNFPVEVRLGSDSIQKVTALP
jgi:hypothetical protein